MQVVKVFFTILIIVLVCWLVADTTKMIILKVKDKKAKKQQKQDSDKVEKQLENDNHD